MIWLTIWLSDYLLCTNCQSSCQSLFLSSSVKLSGANILSGRLIIRVGTWHWSISLHSESYHHSQRKDKQLNFSRFLAVQTTVSSCPVLIPVSLTPCPLLISPRVWERVRPVALSGNKRKIYNLLANKLFPRRQKLLMTVFILTCDGSTIKITRTPLFLAGVEPEIFILCWYRTDQF